MALANERVIEKVSSLHGNNSNTGNFNKSSSNCRVCDSRGLCLAEQMIDDKGQLEQVRRNGRPYKPGEHLFRAGDQGSELHVVKCVSVKSYLITEEGEEQVLGFYMPGDVIGLDGCGSQLHSSSATALATTTTCRLPVAQMSEQGQGRTYPALAASQLSRDQNLVLMLARKDADGRVAGFLMDLSQRFKRIGYSATEFNLSMSRQDIGSYLGLAIETVSRTLTRFQEAGLIEVKRRNLEILDIDSLKRVAGITGLH